MRRDTMMAVVEALEDAVKEHGAPNTFSPGWLRVYHDGPTPTQAGRVAHFHLFAINQHAAMHDPPFSVTYQRPVRGKGALNRDAAFVVAPLATGAR